MVIIYRLASLAKVHGESVRNNFIRIEIRIIIIIIDLIKIRYILRIDGSGRGRNWEILLIFS